MQDSAPVRAENSIYPPWAWFRRRPPDAARIGLWPFPCRIGRSPVLQLTRFSTSKGSRTPRLAPRWTTSCPGALRSSRGSAGAHESAWERLYQDLVPLFGDTPDGQRGHEPPSLEFLRREFRQLWQVLLGCRGDRNVGTTLVMARADGEGRVSTFFTGVVPDERSQGWPQC